MITRIKKLEHSSFLLEHKDKRIVFDPGGFSTTTEDLHNIDFLIITHSHGDHFNVDNIKYILSNSQNLKIITNSDVKNKLEKEIQADIINLDNSQKIELEGIEFLSEDQPHEEIYGDFNLVQNTGYYIDDVFFHPGDAFTKPLKTVKAVSTVIIAPFMRLKMAIDYIKENPNMIHFGVHDSVAQPLLRGWLKQMIKTNIDEKIQYEHPESNNEFIIL